MNYKKKLTKEDIAYRASLELPDNSYVNLGIGLPSLCAKYLDPKKNITFQAENGILGFDQIADEDHQDENLVDAGGQFLVQNPGISFFDSADSFAMIRGGHIDVTVLGGTAQKDDWEENIRPEDSEYILTKCEELWPELDREKIVGEAVGLRPSRNEVRLEKEELFGKNE